MARCAFCRHELKIEGRVMRKDACPSCGRDLHACVQCRFHDRGRQNQCREPRAAMVRDRDRQNVCDYFEIAAEAVAGEDQAEARRRLEDLFKPKPD